MADDGELTVMELFSDMGTLIGLGMDISSIFGGDGTPSAGQIAALVAQEVEAIFFQQNANTVVTAAADALDTVRIFLSSDYLNAQTSGESNADLWTLLNSPSNPGIANLENAQNSLLSWLQQNAGVPPGASGSYATQAASVGLGLAIHLCLLHRERSKCAPDPQTAAAELADMRDKARIAIAGDPDNNIPGFQQAVEDAIGSRNVTLAILNGTYEDHDSSTDWAMTRLPDAWLANQDQPQLWVQTDLTLSGQDAATAFAYQSATMNPIYANYKNVLWDARPQDCTALQTGFPPDVWRGTGTDFTNGDEFSAENFDNICAFGTWVTAARGTLMGLDLTASGLLGQQEDDWRICRNCNGAFHGLDDYSCPAGSVHDASDSPNFVMRQQVTNATTPPNSESSWNGCTQCHGVFRSGGGNVCAAGGSHVAGQAYFMCTGDPPDQALRGIDNTTSGFVDCTQCSLLYFPAGNLYLSSNMYLEFANNGACPAGGQHTSSSAPTTYWLSWIAFWKGGIPFVFGNDATAALKTPSLS